MKSFIKSMLSLLLVFIFLGCASSTSEYPQYSGFLSDYKGLHLSGELENIFLIKSNSVGVNEYTKFLVNPVTIQLTRDAKAYNMDEATLRKIAADFTKEIKAALRTNGTVMNGPGEDVLLVRVAITDVFKGNSLSSAKGIVEAEFVNSITGERVAAAVTSAKGMYFDRWAAQLRDRIIYLRSDTKVYK